MPPRRDRQKTRPIPQREWDHHKNKILSRRNAGMKSRDLVNMLCEEGLQVTFSQLQTQLRRWKSRQNLDRNGWVLVLSHMDGLVFQGKEVRIKLSGEVVDPKTVKNARRYLRHIEPSRVQLTPETCPESVAIEAREPGENWRLNVQHIADAPIDHDAFDLDDDADANAFENGTTDPPVEIPMETQAEFASALPTLEHDFGAFPVVNQDWANGYEQIPTTSAVDWIGSFTNQHNLSPLVPYMSPNNATAMSPMSQLLTESVRGLRPSSPYLAGGTKCSVLPLDTPFILSCFNSLPSIELHRGLASAGIRFRPLNREADDRAAVPDPALPLQSETVTRLSEILVPGFRPTLPGLPTSASDSLSSNNVLESQRTNILIAALLNGPSSLSGVDIPQVLGTMHRQADLPHVISQLLRSSPRFAARSMAENLLKAAIESQSVATAKMLLATDLVDINSLVCAVDGISFTALDRAALSENLSMVQLLLQKGADPKLDTHPENCYLLGTIGKLVESWPDNATITPKMTVLVETLAAGGARVDMRIIENILRRFSSIALAKLLLPHLPHEDYTGLSTEFIRDRVNISDEEFSIEVVRMLYIVTCELSGCEGCRKSIDDTWIQEWVSVAITRHQFRLFKLLLPYTDQSTHFERHEVVLPFDDQAVRLASERYSQSLDHVITGWSLIAYRLTLNDAPVQADEWPFALSRADNENLPHQLRLCLFWEGLRYYATVGDLDRVRELLEGDLIDHPDLSGLPSVALKDALSQGHLDVAWEVMDRETRFNSYIPHLHIDELLIQALQQKRIDLATAILDCFRDWICVNEALPKALEAVLQWGDRTMIMECFQCRPEFYDLKLDGCGILGSIDTDTLRFIIESGLLREPSFAPVLEAGLSKNDSNLVQLISEYTTHPESQCLEVVVAYNRIDLLREFLQRCRYTRFSAPPDYGLSAILLALEQGDSGLEALEMLVNAECVSIRRCGLECNLVDRVNCAVAPLAVAIVTVSGVASTDVGLSKCPVRRLLDSGCSPNDCTLSRLVAYRTRVSKKRLGISFEDKSAMLQAIATGNTALVELFLEYDAHLNEPVALGLTRTPLQRAVEVNSMSIVRTLLQHGADINAPPARRKGFTCVQLAAINGNCNMLAELLIHGAHLHTPPNRKSGRWPLEGAAEHNQLDMVSFLWQLNRGEFEEAIRVRAKKLARGNGHLGCVQFIEELESSRWQPPAASFTRGAEAGHDEQQWVQELAENFLTSTGDYYEGGVPQSF